MRSASPALQLNPWCGATARRGPSFFFTILFRTWHLWSLRPGCQSAAWARVRVVPSPSPLGLAHSRQLTRLCGWMFSFWSTKGVLMSYKGLFGGPWC